MVDGGPPLAEMINEIHSFSDSTPHLCELLKKLQQREDQLIQMLPELDDVATALEPATHTLGLIFILCVPRGATRFWPRPPLTVQYCPCRRSCKAGAVPLSQPHAARTFCEQCRRMLLSCDPQQVHLVPSQFVSVCTKFTAAAKAEIGISE